MKTRYRAYIDEAGDEGFQFWADGGGSSRWLVLSAVIAARSVESVLGERIDELSEVLTYRGRKKALHFRGLSHDERVVAAKVVGKAPIRTISVIVNKEAIRKSSEFSADGHTLYRYGTKFLLERISWLCKDDARKKKHSDCTCEVIFSKRDSMSYEKMTDYLKLLKDRPERELSKINWDVLSPSRVQALRHETLPGLIMADVVASGIYSAISFNRFRETEPRYFASLKPTLWKKRGKASGAGYKFWPEPPQILTDEEDRLAVFDP